MARFTLAGLTALYALFMLFAQAAAQCTPVTGRYRPKMASGYKSSVLATGLRSPRGIAMDPEGNLLVVEQSGGSVRRLVLKEDGDNVCVESSAVLVSGGAVSWTPPRRISGQSKGGEGRIVPVANITGRRTTALTSLLMAKPSSSPTCRASRPIRTMPRPARSARARSW